MINIYNHDNEYDEYDMLEVKERLFSYVSPNNTEVYDRAVVGDRIMAVIAGTTTVVSEFEITFDQSLYSLYSSLISLVVCRFASTWIKSGTERVFQLVQRLYWFCIRGE